MTETYKLKKEGNLSIVNIFPIYLSILMVSIPFIFVLRIVVLSYKSSIMFQIFDSKFVLSVFHTIEILTLVIERPPDL